MRVDDLRDGTSAPTDLHSTLEYGQSHDLARQLFPTALVGIAIGFVLLTSFDGKDVEVSQVMSGGALIAISVGLLALILYRLTRPSISHIILSPRGILFTGVSQSIIPWGEVREVGVTHVRAVEEATSTKVTKIVVSQQFYNSITRIRSIDSVVAMAGNPSEIYLSYYHRLPFEEFHNAVVARWRAFSPYAGDDREQLAAPAPSPDPHKFTSPSHSSAVRRADSILSGRTLSELARKLTPLQKVVSGAALVGIVVLVANMLGIWSTATQREGRAKAAEWRAKWEQFEADRRTSDAERRRVDEMWDQKFKCLDDASKSFEVRSNAPDPACVGK